MDLGHKMTDDMLKDMEKRIQKVYSQAAKEMEQKVSKHYLSYTKSYMKKVADLNAGKITKAEFSRWSRGQMMTGKRWREMRDTIAQDLTNADKLAASMTRGYLPEVYALNHNFGTYEIEHGLGIDTSYTLYDRQTVERLIRDNPKLLPSPKVDTARDLRWNKEKFTNGITQGILQGESIPDIAKRVALGTTKSDYVAALRNARTATTGAENAGRMDSYERANNMGIMIGKVWMSTLDGRTRDSHRDMDGEEQPYDEEFSNGLMYPGDPDGEPGEVWNCRCTMVADVDGAMDADMSDLSMRNSNLGDMSYDEWKYMHEYDDVTDIVDEGVSALANIRTIEQARTYFMDSYGITVHSSVDKLNFDHVKMAMSGIDDTLKEYPELVGNVKMLGTLNRGYMCSDGVNVYFNPVSFGMEGTFDDAYQAGSHELGHCLEMMMCKKDAALKLAGTGATDRLIELEAISQFGSNTQARKIVSTAIKNVKKTHPEWSRMSSAKMRERISNYATATTGETIAESVGNIALDKYKGRVDNSVGGVLAREITSLVKMGVSQ